MAPRTKYFTYSLLQWLLLGIFSFVIDSITQHSGCLVSIAEPYFSQVAYAFSLLVSLSIPLAAYLALGVKHLSNKWRLELPFFSALLILLNYFMFYDTNLLYGIFILLVVNAVVVYKISAS